MIFDREQRSKVLTEALLFLLFLVWKNEWKMFQMEQKMCKGTKSVQGVNRVFSVRKGFLNVGLYFFRNLFKKAFQISDVLLFLATFKGHSLQDVQANSIINHFLKLPCYRSQG